MKKKLVVLLLVFSLTLFAAVGMKYVIDTGFLRGYPDAEYLTAEEASARPVYNKLTVRERAIYSALYRGIKEKKETIPLPFEVKGGEYSKVYRILEKQEGEFFYLDSVYYTAKKIREARIAYKKELDTELRVNSFDSAVKKAVAGGSGTYGSYYIAAYISNYIINNCKYVIGEDDMYASTAYGCLVEGKANCEGYAKAFDVLAAKMGLESQLITGVTDKGENHAWNQVKIGLDWYNIDVTWEDTDVAGDVRREYFLRPDSVFLRSHTPDEELFEPEKCVKDEWSFFKVTGSFADSIEQAEDIIKSNIRAGSRSIDIEFDSLDLYEKFVYVMNNEERVRSIIQDSGVSFDGILSIKLRENMEERCLTVIIEEEK